MAQEVEVKIKVETSQAVNDVNKLGDAFDNTKTDAEEAQKVFSKAGNGVQVEQSISGLKQLKRELKNTAVGSEEFKKIYNQIDDLEDKLKSAKNVSSDWVDSLEQAGGPLGMLGAGLNKAKVATQSFGGALKATGIGLIVSLLGGLVAAFRDNENATKKLQPLLDGIGKIFNGVFRAVEPLFNTLVDLAINALPMVSKSFGVVYSSVTAVFQSLGMLGGAIKKLISGDFSGAWKDAKSSVNDFGKNYDASIKRFNDGTKEMSKTEKDEADKRTEARRKAQEKRNADQEKAKQDAIAKAQAEADALKKIEEEKLAVQMASAQEVMDKEKELRETQETPAQKEEREYQEWLTKYQANNLNTDLLTQQHLDTLANIKKTDADKKKEIDDKQLADAKAKADKEIEIEQTLRDAKRNALDTSLNILQQFAGKNKAISLGILAVQKGLAIADVVIGASKSIAVSNANLAMVPAILPPGIPNPAYPFAVASNLKGILSTKISAATSIASILASGIGTASSITAGGGNSSSSGGGISTPSTSQPINVVGASQTNAIAQTMMQQGQTPIKAYVVANDVTTQQALTRNIVKSASIG